MNIAIIVEQFPVLSETFITNKVLELCRRGHNVTVITHRRSKNASLYQLYQLDRISNLKIILPIIPATALQWVSLLTRKPGMLLQAMPILGGSKTKARDRLLATLFAKKNFHIVHFEFSAIALLYANVLPHIKASTVVSCRGTAEKVKPLTVAVRKEEMAHLFAAVSAIHCVSGDMANTVRELGASAEKIFINRPSIDVEYFAPRGKKEPAGIISILSVGRFTFQKNYLTGLLAVKKLKEKFPSFTWSIVGEGPQMEEIIYHIHALGLQNEVKLLGKKNKVEVLELYTKADVFLLSSVYEGIANVVLEAMAMELPVVCTRCGGMEEVITGGVDGILADVYAYKEIANQLHALCTNDKLRQTIGKMARQKVAASFTLARQVDQFESVYKQLAGEQ